MEHIVINGGSRLSGKITVSGMKNAALPIIFATILAEDVCVIENLPEINDVASSLEIFHGTGLGNSVTSPNLSTPSSTHIFTSFSFIRPQTLRPIFLSLICLYHHAVYFLEAVASTAS